MVPRPSGWSRLPGAVIEARARFRGRSLLDLKPCLTSQYGRQILPCKGLRVDGDAASATGPCSLLSPIMGWARVNDWMAEIYPKVGGPPTAS